MTVLRHLFSTGQGPLWFTAEGTWTARELSSAAMRLRTEVSGGAGTKVALRQPDSFRTALWLSALDGWSASILLLPSSLEEAQVVAFCEQAGCETVLCQDPVPFLTDTTPVVIPEVALESHWIIPTSGTTGTPKLVSHTLATLSRSARQDKVRGAEFRWGLLYDVTRFAGIQVFLQAVCGGSGLIFPDPHLDLGDQLTFLACHGCTALSATPTLWRKMLMFPGAPGLSLRNISMGGEIADRRVLEAAAVTWPNAKVRHIYASTEAGVGFSISDGLPGFPVDFLTTSPPGVEMRVDENNMLWLRPAVRGQDYIQEELRIESGGGWIETGDIVKQEGDRFLFCGRENGAINVGGNKVYPQEVEDVILEVPGVAAAVVSGRPNPIMGQLVEAQIVAAPGGDTSALRTAILTACREKLPRWQVPATFKFVASISTTAAGKAARL
jgi:acyl-CoA synthetase (AMP-forming)/AMP-acid ligase II